MHYVSATDVDLVPLLGTPYCIRLGSKHLGLDSSKVASYRGKSALIVGEGPSSSVLPIFLKLGVIAVAVDQVTKLPFENDSVDLVVSREKVINAPLIRTLLLAREAVRVLKKGGKAYIFGFDAETLAVAQKSLREKYGYFIRMSPITKPGVPPLGFQFYYPNGTYKKPGILVDNNFGQLAFEKYLLVIEKTY